MAVKELVLDIKTNLKQKSASTKDEIAVMQAMLNDRDYSVGVYDASGKVGEYNPRQDAVGMIGSVIASTTKIGKDEAAALASEHEFTKGESTTFINVGKEFINTYGQTGRKINLGGRETSSVSLIMKEVPAGECHYPQKQEDGTTITATKAVPAYTKIVAKASCPSWVK